MRERENEHMVSGLYSLIRADVAYMWFFKKQLSLRDLLILQMVMISKHSLWAPVPQRGQQYPWQKIPLKDKSERHILKLKCQGRKAARALTNQKCQYNTIICLNFVSSNRSSNSSTHNNYISFLSHAHPCITYYHIARML